MKLLPYTATYSLLLLIIFLISGCDLFAPREPEDPEASRGSFIPPTSADIVIENLVNAIGERNTQHYVQCFVDTAFSDRSYRFVPTQNALQLYADLFTEWSVREERSYLENLLAQTPSNATIRLEFFEGTFEIISSDSTLYNVQYRLTARHSDEGFPHQVFRGTTRLAIGADRNNNWGIYRWEDFQAAGEPSWSELKGRFVQ